MMKKAALALAAVGLTATPAASAQNWNNSRNIVDAYSDNCEDIQNENRVIGALIGGVAGSLLGNEIAARGVRTEGRWLGGVVGALAGSEIGRRNVDCDTTYIGPADGYYDAGYSDTSYRYPGKRPHHQNHEPEYRYDERGLIEDHQNRARASYGDDSARQCQEVVRVTYLPDGREVQETTTACRPLHYGDWSLNKRYDD